MKEMGPSISWFDFVKLHKIVCKKVLNPDL